jgi:hypothetical protein
LPGALAGGALGDLGRPRRAPGLEPRSERLVREGKDRAGQKRGIDRARFADRERPDRHAGRHLHDREQAVLARERLRGDRHAEHRQRRERRSHARQMRSAPGPRDDNLEARALRPLCESDEPVGRAMGGDDARLISNAQIGESLGGSAHDRPVRLAAHDDRDRLRYAIHRRPPAGESKSIKIALSGRPLVAQATQAQFIGGSALDCRNRSPVGWPM